MTDSHTLLVSYKPERGEPRGPFAQRQRRKRPTGRARGDCIDCKACVVVCPTGIDIRDGSQLECIQCGLCIDACNEIMDKVGRPRGLVAYDTVAKQAAKAAGAARADPAVSSTHDTLPRLMLAIVGAIMLVGLVQSRECSSLNVLSGAQSALRAAFGGRRAQCIHCENPQQAARTAGLRPAVARPARCHTDDRRGIRRCRG